MEDENRRRIEGLENEHYALDEKSWDMQNKMQSFYDDLEERTRDEFDAIETRRMELDEERWALDDEMRQKFEEAEATFRDQKQEHRELITAVVDDQLGPLEEEALDLEMQLEDLYTREHALQRELAAFSQEIAPLRQTMESSMLDLLDSAIQAAESNPMIFADDSTD